MNYIIINWTDLTHILPIVNEDGTTMLFETYEDALVYGTDNLNFYWKVVEICIESYGG